MPASPWPSCRETASFRWASRSRFERQNMPTCKAPGPNLGGRQGRSFPMRWHWRSPVPSAATVLKLTNSPWVVHPAFNRASSWASIEVTIVNDFGAVAHAVAQLGPEHFDHCCGPDGPMPTTGLITIIGPGTGLGVAQLLRTAGRLSGDRNRRRSHRFRAAGSGRGPNSCAICGTAFPRVSVERIVSGSGLANLYGAMAAIEGGCSAVDGRRGDLECGARRVRSIGCRCA